MFCNTKTNAEELSLTFVGTYKTTAFEKLHQTLAFSAKAVTNISEIEKQLFAI